MALGEDRCALSQPIESLMSDPVLSLPERTRLGDAVVYFKSEGIRHCLVVDDEGRAMGMLTQTDLVMSQGTDFFLRMKPIDSANVSIPAIVGPELKLREVMAMMRMQRLSAIVVRFPAGEHGILTERDIVRLAAAGSLDGAAGDHASRPSRSLRRSQSLYAARQCLVESRARHVGVLDEQDKLTGLLGLSDLLDNIEYEYVHEQKAALRERDDTLLESRYHLRLADRVFESTLDGVMVTDPHGTIERVNPAFTRLTGYSQSEALGRNPRILSSGRQSAEFYRNLWKHLRESGHWKGEIWNPQEGRRTVPRIFVDLGHLQPERSVHALCGDLLGHHTAPAGRRTSELSGDARRAYRVAEPDAVQRASDSSDCAGTARIEAGRCHVS